MVSQLLINSIIAGGTYTLIALSFSLIYSTTMGSVSILQIIFYYLY